MSRTIRAIVGRERRAFGHEPVASGPPLVARFETDETWVGSAMAGSLCRARMTRPRPRAGSEHRFHGGDIVARGGRRVAGEVCGSELTPTETRLERILLLNPINYFDHEYLKFRNRFDLLRREAWCYWCRMVGRKNDPTPSPPGGRAAERLRQFEQARGLEPSQPAAPTRKKGPGTEEGPQKTETPTRKPPARQSEKRQKD